RRPRMGCWVSIPGAPAVGYPPPPRVEHLQALLVPRVIPSLRRDMALRTPLRIPGPVLGQGQAEVEQGMIVARDVPHEDADLAIVDLPPVATPLAFDAHRVRAALGEAAGIEGDDAIGLTQRIGYLSDQHCDQGPVVPRSHTDEVL